jgi:hypothetical protein
MGAPSLLRAIALEYLKTFDEQKVAEVFETTPKVVAKVLSRPDIQEYVAKRMIPIEDLATMGARRLLEESLKTAFDPDVEWKERTENRKILAKTLLPEIKKISVDHRFYIETPGKIEDAEEWARKFQPQPPVVEAEIIEAEDDE